MNRSDSRILLVEDEALIAMAEKEQLEKLGYSVHRVATGEEAVAAATVHDPGFDLVLMDINLGPGIDGTQAAEQILNRIDIPIVFLSSHSEPQIVERTERITSYGYVVKNSGVTVFDVSIRMALRLFKSRTIYKETFEHSINGLCIHRMLYDENNTPYDCEYVSVSPSFETHTGLSPKFLDGKTIRQIYPGDQADEVIELYAQVMTSGTARIDEFYFEPTGRWYSLNVFPMDESLFTVVVQNISEQKLTQKKLERSEEQYRRLFDTMSPGVVYQNPDGAIVDANPSAEQLLGLTVDQMNGKSSMDPRWRMITEDGEDVPGPEHPAMVALKTGQRVGPVDRGVFVPERNEYVWLSITAIPLFHPQEAEPYQVYATFDDITERRRAEQEIERQLREKEILLQEVHHRIKNNMAQVEGLLSLQANASESADVRAALQETIARVQSIRVLYEKLLIGKEYEVVSIKEYAESLIDSLVAVFPERGNVMIERNITDFCLGSRTAILVGIILNELLTNVFKYAFKGRASAGDGVLIGGGAHEGDGSAGGAAAGGSRVSIDLDRSETHATLTIRDNGVGVDERTIADRSPGFGLTIVNMLAEQLGGSYSICHDNGTKNVVTFMTHL